MHTYISTYIKYSLFATYNGKMHVQEWAGQQGSLTAFTAALEEEREEKVY